MFTFHMTILSRQNIATDDIIVLQLPVVTSVSLSYSKTPVQHLIVLVCKLWHREATSSHTVCMYSLHTRQTKGRDVSTV